MSDTHTHVIPGAGLAGAKAAEGLREEGLDGRIVLIGEEPEAPYERPPLSKDYLRGESPREKARVHPDGFYADNGVDLRTSTSVESVDTETRVVALSTGERLPYDRLLLATGAEPRRLSLPGSELEGVHYLRDLSDADRLATRVGAGGHVLVIGAGWIGSEGAASARQMGTEVTIVERGEVPLERVLGREVGEIYAGLHRDNGVRLVTGAALERLEGAGRVERVRLSDGRQIECDLVVVGIGVTPGTGLAERAGIALEDGIVTDERLETSVPGVFAAGDVANSWHPFSGRQVRVEHWANALHQPATAARAMLGKPASHQRLPYFFSDQYDLGMEYRGHADGRQHVVLRGDPSEREFIAFWLEDDVVLAAMNINVWDAGDAIGRLISSRRPVAAAELRDPDVPLERLAGASGELHPA